MSRVARRRRRGAALLVLGAVFAAAPATAATDLPRKLSTAADVCRELFSARDLLFEHRVPRLPSEAKEFMEVLP